MHYGSLVAVEMYADGDVEPLIELLESNGAVLLGSGEAFIEAYVPLPYLGEASALPGVLWVRPVVTPVEEQIPKAQVAQALSGPVSEHGARSWHAEGYTGKGIKVGIIDIGFEGFTSLMGSELPETVHARCYLEDPTLLQQYTSDVADCEYESNHGTAVAEAVLDIAPDVTLYIAQPMGNSRLRDTVDWMIAEGVSVINRSAIHSWDGPGDGTSPFESSPLRTVDRAVDAGIVWINGAGNEARKMWTGEFSKDLDRNSDGWVEFDTIDQSNTVEISGGSRFTAQLRWDDPWEDWFSGLHDLDLYLYDSDDKEVASSRDRQSIGLFSVPYELLSYTAPEGKGGFYHLKVAYRKSGLDEGGTNWPEWIQLHVLRGKKLQHAKPGRSIGNPADSKNPGMLAVGASPWDAWGNGSVRDTSSRGPTSDGRTKPDVVGADGGESVVKRRTWFGTSQAAPHVAGLAALVRQRYPDLSPSGVTRFLKDRAAVPGGVSVPSNEWGYGFARLSAEDLSKTPPPEPAPQPKPTPVATISPTPGLTDDRAALAALYYATDGPNWYYETNWLSNAPIGERHGVTTDGSGRVTELELEDNLLVGELPAELDNLTNLMQLNLSENRLSGEIPTELNRLPNLIGLDLSENQLSGEIPPELDSLANLEYLDLFHNQLYGEIPPELGNLRNLRVLYVGTNELSGEIPPELGNLPNLESLGLGFNELSGEIPPALGNLPNLRVLYLDNNQLYGEIPPELGNLRNLRVLYVDNNQLYGEIPPELGNLRNLRVLYVGTNELSGEIPPALGNLPNLRVLYLDNNQLSGEIPPELGNLASLESLGLGYNDLSGVMPPELGNLANLEYLDLSGNELTGEIPTELGNLANLEQLNLSVNELTGEIPPELGNLANLERLNLSANELTGEIPPELGNLANLEYLNLSLNELTGEIPPELGNLTNLEGLYLDTNCLTGCVPSSLQDQLHFYEFGDLPFCDSITADDRPAEPTPEPTLQPTPTPAEPRNPRGWPMFMHDAQHTGRSSASGPAVLR